MPQMTFNVNKITQVILEQGVKKTFPLIEDAVKVTEELPESIERWQLEGRRGRSGQGGARDGQGVKLGVVKVDTSTPTEVTKKFTMDWNSIDMKLPIKTILNKTGQGWLIEEHDEEDETSLITTMNAAVTALEVASDTLTTHNFTDYTDQQVVDYLEARLNLLDPWGTEIDRILVSATSGYAERLQKILQQWSVSQAGNTANFSILKISPRVSKLLETGIRVERAQVWDHRHGDNRHLNAVPYQIGYHCLLYGSNKSPNPFLKMHDLFTKMQTVTVPGGIDEEQELVYVTKRSYYVDNRKAGYLIKDAFKPLS